MNAERPRDAEKRTTPVGTSGASARAALHPFGVTVLYRVGGRRRIADGSIGAGATGKPV